MSDTSIDLNGVRCLSVRLVTCTKGAWFADCDLDPDSDPVTSADVPSGKVTITIAPPGATPIVLKGTVSQDSAGRMVSSVPVRVVGGLGWTQLVTGQHFHSDAGVSSVTVENATAAVVNETVNDPSPASLGVDWVRPAGPASSVFGDRDWYVDPAGVTQIGARPPAQPDATVELLEWDPQHQRGILSADALVLPGTQITDPRFDGPITVRDAIQTWDHTGTRVEIFCGPNPAGRLATNLTNMVRALAGISTLKRYRYRIVTQNAASAQGPSRLVLQPLPNPDGSPTGAPPLNPVLVAPGMSGLSAMYALSSSCTVAFANGDPRQPFVEAFDSATIPVELTVDASSVLHVGPSAATVKIAENSSDYQGAPLCRVGDTGVGMLPPLVPVAGTMIVGGATVPFVGTMTVTQPLVVTMISGKASALG